MLGVTIHNRNRQPRTEAILSGRLRRARQSGAMKERTRLVFDRGWRASVSISGSGEAMGRSDDRNIRRAARRAR